MKTDTFRQSAVRYIQEAERSKRLFLGFSVASFLMVLFCSAGTALMIHDGNGLVALPSIGFGLFFIYKIHDYRKTAMTFWTEYMELRQKALYTADQFEPLP